MSDSKKTFKVLVNGFEFLFDQEEIETADLRQIFPGEYNLIKDHNSVNAKLLDHDITCKHARVEVDGETFEIEIRDPLDQMLDQMGFSSVSTKHIKDIKAPMPGMVLEVSVTEGQEVKEGERLLILSAMKMENSILIHADGKIKNIKVKAGQAVDKGQVLVELG